MGDELSVAVAKSSACAGCSLVLSDPDVSCSSIILTRKALPFVKVWNPSDDPKGIFSSQRVNQISHGALTKMFLKPSLAFSTTFSLSVGRPGFVVPMTSGTINLMSVYHPFPLRIDGTQAEACFQIGEFGSANWIAGSGVVVLIPLVSSNNATGDGATFISKFAGRMTSVVAARDVAIGYDDINVTLSDWKLKYILESSRPFYTWINKDGTRVVVMAEPISISLSDMASITQSIPATSPSDAIQEIHTPQYRPAPVDCTKTPKLCAKPIVQPDVPMTTGEMRKGILVNVLTYTGYAVAGFIGVWLVLRFARAYGTTIFQHAGRGLAGLLGGVRGAAGAAANAASAAGQGAAGAAANAASAAGQGAAGAASAAGQGAAGAASAVGRGAAGAASAVGRGAAGAASAVGRGAAGAASAADRSLRVAANKLGFGPNSGVSQAKKDDANASRNARSPKNGSLTLRTPTQPEPSKADQAAAAGVGNIKPLEPRPDVPNELRKHVRVGKKTEYKPSPNAIATKAKVAAIRARRAAAKIPAKTPGQRRDIGPVEGGPAPNLKTQYMAKTGAVVKGGKRRRRHKTGRRI